MFRFHENSKINFILHSLKSKIDNHSCCKILILTVMTRLTQCEFHNKCEWLQDQWNTRDDGRERDGDEEEHQLVVEAFTKRCFYSRCAQRVGKNHESAIFVLESMKKQQRIKKCEWNTQQAKYNYLLRLFCFILSHLLRYFRSLVFLSTRVCTQRNLMVNIKPHFINW